MIQKKTYKYNHEPEPVCGHSDNPKNQWIGPVGAGSPGLGGGVSALQSKTHLQPGGTLQLRQPVPRVP